MTLIDIGPRMWKSNIRCQTWKRVLLTNSKRKQTNQNPKVLIPLFLESLGVILWGYQKDLGPTQAQTVDLSIMSQTCLLLGYKNTELAGKELKVVIIKVWQ